MTHEEYLAHDASGLAQRVRQGDVTAGELLEIALERIAALNPKLNAVVRLMEEDARQDAARPPSGPFAGVPFLAKDLISTYAGHPTSAATPLLADHVVHHDSELARRVRASGVSVVGKTNLPEWGLLPITEPKLWGPCRNPWATEHTPGGSSGGSAAAVAARMVPIAGGGDGGGSIRIPASCCGLFGLKPTRGRTPTGPDYGLLWRGAAVEHVLTRTVRDSAAMLDATHGPDAGAPLEIPPPERAFLAEVSADPGRLRIAWTTAPALGSEVHPECIAAVEATVALLAELGHELVESGPAVDGPSFSRAFLTMVAAELAADLDYVGRLLGRRPGRRNLEPATWALALAGRAIPASEYAAALRTMERAGRDIGAFFAGVDLLLSPTLAAPPPRIGDLQPSALETTLLRILGVFGSGRLVRSAGLLDQAAATAFELTPWTPLYNATGQPAMSVPLHWSAAGLPVGVHFAARFGDEATLLRLAGQLERARPWLERLPTLARSHA
ncbi:MAG TPA: amidase [Longimicrobiales bacterium]|nr:amidase [Longimicrobiales bacterium]